MKVSPRQLDDYPIGSYIPNLDPPVIIARHLPADLCAKVLAAGMSSVAIQSGVFDPSTGKETHDSYHRSSSFVTMPPEIYDEVAARLTNIITGYIVGTGKVAELGEPLQFLRYDSANKGHFRAHTDNAYYDAYGKFHYTSPQRHLSMVAYVNDDYEGGELIMHTVTHDDGRVLRLKPKVGEVVIFPSDIRFLHEVTPVTAGNRVSIVGWFRLK